MRMMGLRGVTDRVGKRAMGRWEVSLQMKVQATHPSRRTNDNHSMGVRSPKITPFAVDNKGSMYLFTLRMIMSNVTSCSPMIAVEGWPW